MLLLRTIWNGIGSLDGYRSARMHLRLRSLRDSGCRRLWRHDDHDRCDRRRRQGRGERRRLGPISAGGVSGEEGLGGETGSGAVSGEGASAGFPCSELGGVSSRRKLLLRDRDRHGLFWGSARETCEEYSPSSHLATITSDAEQSAIEDAFSPSVTDYWIGLSLGNVEHDPDEECDEEPERCPFEWVTGDALSYANWAEHSQSDVEPNYTGACVRLQLDGFAWADFDCSTRLPALCEHDH